MELLKQRILKDAKISKDNVLKVDSFLNHQIDVSLIDKIGEAFYSYFKNMDITKILTVESSGIAIAFSVAKKFNIPLLFAKKTLSKNINGEVFISNIKSYTKDSNYLICVSKKFLLPIDKVLLIDDFLANGSALLGLIDIAKQSGSKVKGAGIVIEKSFQQGKKMVKEKGINIYSLVKIQSISNNRIIFKE